MSEITMEFSKGGIFRVELLIEDAPRSCQVITEKLPFEYRFHQSIVSGQALVTLPPDMTMEPENQRVAGVPVGALAFLIEDSARLVPDEIYIAYGLFISRGLTLDMKQPVNVFGQVHDDLEHLATVGRRVLMEGAETVRFESA